MNPMLKTMLGAVFLLVGIAGILLPFLPGVVFLMLALNYFGGNDWLKSRLNGMLPKNWFSDRLSRMQRRIVNISRTHRRERNK